LNARYALAAGDYAVEIGGVGNAGPVQGTVGLQVGRIGAHPYLVTPEHTATARERLGEGPLLAPEIKVVLESGEGDQAAKLATEALSQYGDTDVADALTMLKRQADALVGKKDRGVVA
jgi:hypothetical protein